MRKIIIGLLVLCSGAGYTAVSFQEAKAIFKQLEQKAGVFNVPLVLKHTDEVNAETDGNQVIINSGLLLFVDNKEELALVLGHELGHIKAHGVGGKQAEYNADAYGASLIASGGYSACKGREFFRKMAKYHGNESSSSHPKNLDRYNKLGAYCMGDSDNGY